jgi:hypothetical protein
MLEFNLEDHNNELAFRERATDFRDKISLWANENHVRVDVIGLDWPGEGSKLKLSRDGSQAWLEVESMPPGNFGNSEFYGPGRGIVITSGMTDKAGLGLIIDRANEPGWLLLRRERQEYKMHFDDVRRGLPVLDLFDEIKPLLSQTFQSESQVAAQAGGRN